MGPLQLHLGILGPFEARFHDGRLIKVNLKAARLLLSWLSLRPSQSVCREEIAALLWSERSEAQAHQSLRQTLAVLRRCLHHPAGELLKVDRENVALASNLVQSDAAFLLGLEAGSVVENLERAVGLYRGELLDGLVIRDPLAQQWLQDRRAELRTKATKCFEWLLAAYAMAGRHTDAEPIATRLIEIDPLAEEGHRALIRSHLAGGKRAMAVRQYQRCRDILARELEVEPAEETQALIRATGAAAEPSANADISRPRQQDPPLGRTRKADNLPRQLTSLIGRAQELDQVRSRLGRHRLVTLTGPGGAGKTRLAIEAGFDLLCNYADGVWLVELGSIADPQLVGEALCASLGVPVTGDRPAVQSAIAHLSQKEVLLILDNCEHLVAASAHLVEKLLQGCPSVSVLATSREVLSIDGESLYCVPNLDYPSHPDAIMPAEAITYSAVQLFIDRATAMTGWTGGFVLDEANAPAVASICKQVDGIPLAIELAVGRLKMMRVDWLASHIGAFFLGLRRSARVGPGHHQTLRAMLDWSYDLLAAEEQKLLRRLSVFAGGCSLASARWVAGGEQMTDGEVFDLLSSLVEKSLLTVDLSAAEPRYRLLETTRKYALDRQAEKREPGSQPELAAYLLDRFTEAGEIWSRTPTDTWLAGYEPDLDNLRAGLEWAFGVDGNVTLGVELASLSIRLFDELSLFRERERWSDIALVHVDKSASPAIAARLYLARTANSAHGDQSGFSSVEQAVRLLRSADRVLDLGEALARAGAALLTIETIGKSLPFLDDALKVLEPLGPTKPLASCLRSKGVAAYLAGEVSAARTWIGRSMSVCTTVGDTRGIASAQIALAELDFVAGNVQDAIDNVRQMLNGLGHNRRQATLGWSNLASYLLANGDTEQARQAASASLREARTLGWPAAIVRAGEHLALVAVLDGEADTAARLLGYADTFYAKKTASREWTEKVTYQRLMAELSNRLSRTRLSELIEEGGGWSEQQAAQAAAGLDRLSGGANLVTSEQASGDEAA